MDTAVKFASWDLKLPARWQETARAGAGTAGLGPGIVNCDCGKKNERRLVEASTPKHRS